MLFFMLRLKKKDFAVVPFIINPDNNSHDLQRHRLGNKNYDFNPDHNYV